MRTAPSSAKPSPPDEIVELRAPADFGFSGTVKLYRREHASTIALLQSKGYEAVDPKDAA